MKYLKAFFILMVIILMTTIPALALGPDAQDSPGDALFRFAEFIRQFVLTSAALGTLTAALVNILKPLIPIGYADTAAVIVSFVLIVIVAVLKILNPALELAGIEALFQRIIESTVIWIVPLTYLVSWLAKYLHDNFLRGLPLIGRSNSKPNIFSPAAQRYHKTLTDEGYRDMGLR